MSACSTKTCIRLKIPCFPQDNWSLEFNGHHSLSSVLVSLYEVTTTSRSVPFECQNQYKIIEPGDFHMRCSTSTIAKPDEKYLEIVVMITMVTDLVLTGKGLYGKADQNVTAACRFSHTICRSWSRRPRSLSTWFSASRGRQSSSLMTLRGESQEALSPNLSFPQPIPVLLPTHHSTCFPLASVSSSPACVDKRGLTLVITETGV